MRWTKNGAYFKDPKGTQPIWIHCASGEFEYAKPLIREFKTLYPQIPILVTYFSPTYRQQVESHPLVNYAAPLPLDLPGPCYSFIRHHNPRALFIARTDLWPELLTQCYKKNIPCYLFSASLPYLKGLKKMLGFYYRWVFCKLTRIGVINQTDYQNFKRLGLPESILKISGDTRYDQVLHRLKDARNAKKQVKELRNTTLMAGSTWPADESKLLEGLSAFIKSRQVNLIIAPHEPTPSHLSHLEKIISNHGLSFCRISHRHGWKKGCVLIVDQVGILAELYSWADLAFIGGSFGRKVHNVLEPLAAGCVCFVGPDHRNSSEAIELKERRLSGSQFHFVNVFKSSDELKRLIQRVRDEHLKGSQSEIISLVKARRGASGQISQWPINHSHG